VVSYEYDPSLYDFVKATAERVLLSGVPTDIRAYIVPILPRSCFSVLYKVLILIKMQQRLNMNNKQLNLHFFEQQRASKAYDAISSILHATFRVYHPLNLGFLHVVCLYNEISKVDSRISKEEKTLCALETPLTSARRTGDELLI